MNLVILISSTSNDKIIKFLVFQWDDETYYRCSFCNINCSHYLMVKITETALTESVIE